MKNFSKFPFQIKLTPSALVASLCGVAMFYWTVHRANVQAITLDEATTLLFWVLPEEGAQWTPHANNHVLNSVLMRLSVHWFGFNHVSVRLPALLGGLIYLSSVIHLALRITSPGLLRLAFISCLIFNPFTADYFAVARGYSLSLGFTGIALALLAHVILEKRPLSPFNSTIFGMSLALSLCANFASLYTNIFVFLAYVLSINRAPSSLKRGTLALIAPSIITGLCVTILICGSTLLSYPKDQLVWGTDSLIKMFSELFDACFQITNNNLLSPFVAQLLAGFRSVAPSLVTGTFGMLVFDALAKSLLGAKQRRSATVEFAIYLFAIVTGSVFAHWLQYRLLNVPLPFERTSIFFVPPLVLAIGGYVGALAVTVPDRIRRGIVTIVLTLTGVYFAATLRDTYFREWSICADIRAAYPVIEEYCRRTSCQEVISDLNYTPSINVYRLMYHSTTIPFVKNYEQPPPGQLVYVLPRSQYAEFIQQHRLYPVFTGQHSDFTVLVRTDN